MNKNVQMLLSLCLLVALLVPCLSSCTCDHRWQTKQEKAPTCTEDGVRVLSCSKCKEEKQETLTAKGHKMERTSYTAATCDKDGSTVYTCSVCGYTETKKEKALGHDYDIDKTYCYRCHKTNYEVVLPAAPITIKNYSSECVITDFETELDYGADIIIKGKKTADAQGTYAASTIRIRCIVREEDGTIVTTIEDAIFDIIVGQSFTGSFSFYPDAGKTYRIQIVAG